VSFTGMEYPVGASRPVLRFRYQGRLADAAFTPDELSPEEQQRLGTAMAQTREIAADIEAERVKASWLTEWPQPSDEELAVRAADARRAHPSAAEQAEAEGWLLPPAELPEVYRTRSGRIVTEAMIEGWAAEAEAGYDPGQFAPPQPQRQGLWHRDADSPPQPPQQVPDLYQVSTVETINVSKLARVITEMLQGGLLSYEGLGLKLTPGGGRTAEQVERWLRS
jgi:hypothetical protein